MYMANTNAFLMTDSYKATHPFQYPEASKMIAYGECRKAFTPSDQRLVMFGMKYILENYFCGISGNQRLEEAIAFFKRHGPDRTEFPFPEELFKEIVKRDGRWPITIKALPEGSVFYPHTPVYQVYARGKFSRLVTYLESVLTKIW